MLAAFALLAPLLSEPDSDIGRTFIEAVAADGVQFIGYTPSTLDPRDPANNAAVATADLQADLDALRPAFDGLVLYGYHESLTPRIVQAAADRGFRSVLLGIWNPKSADETDGVVALAEQFGGRMRCAIVIGNEGLWFDRYVPADIEAAAARIRHRLPSVPLATSEPFISFQQDQRHSGFVRSFGDLLAPNIHPIFDRPDMDAAAAARWTRQTAAELAEQTGKPLLLKETGFPHAGKEKFSPESQQTFWETLLDGGAVAGPAESPAYLAVAFEAFDLAWKSESSGLEYERSWGLLSPEREPLPSFDWWKRRAPAQ